LTPTIQPLADDPTAVADPYGRLKELLLESYGMTEEQRTSRWLDYPMCGSKTRPSVLWDNLTALRPKTLDEAQVALFIRKLPRHSKFLLQHSLLLYEDMKVFQKHVMLAIIFCI
jgi:hypothetical protein